MDDKNLRIFNFVAFLTIFGLSFWMLIGDKFSKPFRGFSLFKTLNLIEIRDRFSPGIVVGFIIAILILIYTKKTAFVFGQLTVASLTVSGFLISISSYLNDDDVAWAGLGARVAVGCLVLALFTLRGNQTLILIYSLSEKRQTTTSFICLAIFCLIYLPSITQFSGGIFNLFESVTIFNELLLPITGITPLGDFATQYTAMLGWPLLVFKDFSASVIMGSVLIWLFILTIVQIGIIASIGKSVFKKIPFAVILLYASSLVLMKGAKRDELDGSVVGSFFSIPSRTFFPTVLCLALITSLFSMNKKRRHPIFLGALLTITALNNLEFGVPAVVAAVIVLSIVRRHKEVSMQRFLLTIGSSFITLLIIASLFATRSTNLDLGLWVAMVRAQGSGGYMNVPMPIVGTYLIVFAILAAGFVLGVVYLGKTPNLDLSRSAAVATFASTWGILSMLYYTGRSWPSHIQIFFIPLIICIFGIAGIFYHGNYFVKKSFSFRQLLMRLPLAMAIVLPISTFLIAPDPTTEWPRALGGGDEWSSENQSQTKVVQSVVEAMKKYEIEVPDAVYFGDHYASTVQLITGLKNGLALNTLEYSLVSADLRKLACSRLPKLNPKFVISQNDDARMNFVGPTHMDSSCPGMSVLYAPDDLGVTIFNYKKPNN